MSSKRWTFTSSCLDSQSFHRCCGFDSKCIHKFSLSSFNPIFFLWCSLNSFCHLLHSILKVKCSCWWFFPPTVNFLCSNEIEFSQRISTIKTINNNRVHIFNPVSSLYATEFTVSVLSACDCEINIAVHIKLWLSSTHFQCRIVTHSWQKHIHNVHTLCTMYEVHTPTHRIVALFSDHNFWLFSSIEDLQTNFVYEPPSVCILWASLMDYCNWIGSDLSSKFVKFTWITSKNEMLQLLFQSIRALILIFTF